MGRVRGRVGSMGGARRVFRAALVGLAVFVLGGGVFGFVSAGDSPPSVSGSWTFPPLQVGDRGAYVETLYLADGGEVALAAEPRVIFTFEWLPHERMGDSNGTVREAARVRVAEVHEEQSAGSNEPAKVRRYERVFVHSFDLETRRSFAYSEVEERVTSEPRTTTLGVPYVEARHDRVTWTGYDEDYTLLLCGLTGVPHETIELEDPVRGFGDCHTQGVWLQAPAFEAVGIEPETGFLVLRHQGSDDGPFLWYAPDTPFPVQIQARIAKHVGEEVREFVTVIQLRDFQRGTAGPVWRPALLPPFQAPPIEFAPRQPWGPDDSGVDHPFPLSEAFQRARDDPNWTDLRDFLAEHPRAFTERAYYGERTDRGTISRYWGIMVAEGKEGMFFWAVQRDEPYPPDMLYSGMLPHTARTVRYEFERNDEGRDNMAPENPLPLELLPERLPTVRSVLARWEVYRGADYRGVSGNAWAVNLYCGLTVGDQCEEPVADVEAGYDLAQFSYPPGSPLLPGIGNSTNTWRESLLRVRYTGEAASLMEFEDRDRDDLVAALPEPGPADEPTPMAPAAATRAWALPASRYAIGAAAAGLVGALGYWLWPLLKTGALGLFSRIARPEALRNPVRADVMQLIEAEPGIHFQEIARRLNLSQSSADHHLRKLVAVGLVSAHAGRGYTCYFPGGAASRRSAAAAEATKAPGAQRVLAAVAARPGLTAGEIAAAADLAPGTVTYHLARLSQAGLVELRRIGNVLRAEPTGDARALVTASA